MEWKKWFFFYLFHIQMIVDNPHFALPNLYMDRNKKSQELEREKNSSGQNNKQT